MTTKDIIQQASREIGGFALTAYRDKKGVLHAANAVSAIGAWAGALAQAQARALLVTGALPRTDTALLEVKVKSGERYFFGDSINACLLDGDAKSPSFWQMAAPIAGPGNAANIDVLEIAKHTAGEIGNKTFGKPRVDARYKLSEQPIDALRLHGPVLANRLVEMQLPTTHLMPTFGLVAQSFAQFAAGQVKDAPVNVAMAPVDIVRLYMESAVPMSKLDLATVGMAWKA